VAGGVITDPAPTILALTPVDRLDHGGQDAHYLTLHPVPVAVPLDGMAQPHGQDALGQRVVEHHNQHRLPLSGREGLSPAQAHATAAVPGPRGLADFPAPGTAGVDVFALLL